MNLDNHQIREDLVEFVECDYGVTGRAIAKKITELIRSNGLDLSKLHVQAYDGAGGKTKVVAAAEYH